MKGWGMIDEGGDMGEATKCGCLMCLEADAEKLVGAPEEFERIINMEIGDVDDFSLLHTMCLEWWENLGKPALDQARYWGE